jgi:hypothetical protein
VILRILVDVRRRTLVNLSVENRFVRLGRSDAVVGYKASANRCEPASIF